MKPLPLIDTERVSSMYRDKSIDLEGRRLLITRLVGSEQEADLTVPTNCGGYGRIRHFHRETTTGWPSNPLPIDPARAALGLPETDELRAQAFQNAACNWRCWYCFVPFNLLAASPRHSAWLTPSELVDLYLEQANPPNVIDLTGGQPDLIPEWIPWMMEEITARGLQNRIYLWSDDNLSTDYLWRFLSDDQRRLMVEYPNYGRVGCFKGFDADSFSFNTRAAPELFDRQFTLMRRLIDLGLDVYGYATFTAPRRSKNEVRSGMARFVDRLQTVDRNLPLRTVPLEIRVFTPVKERIGDLESEALNVQADAIHAWQTEITNRYSGKERSQNVAHVPLRRRS
jgi:uncharacterized Fe-S cluster-containing radical SAM superfamily protein